MFAESQRPLNVGFIGGGSGFITNAHQRAIFMDGTRRVTAAALSSNPSKAMELAGEWPYPIKGYESYQVMIEAESALPEGGRIDYVVIMTPNDAHYEPSKAFLEAGIPVMCEKPLTLTVAEAESLRDLVTRTNIPFRVAHTYLGHWTSQLARYIVRSGKLGCIRWVDASYLNSSIAIKSRKPGFPETLWRLNPEKSGLSNCGGDIGTHALMQLRYVTGLEVEELSAHLETYVPVGDDPAKRLDDHFTAYCRLSGGANGLVRASQISIGHKNDMRLEVVGESGSIRWSQEDSEKLIVNLLEESERVYWRGGFYDEDDFLGDMPDELKSSTAVPWGHAEGLNDAFARLHRAFEGDVRAYRNGNYEGADGAKGATVADGVAGLRFVEAAVESNRNGNAWVKV